MNIYPHAKVRILSSSQLLPVIKSIKEKNYHENIVGWHL